jgi:CubicO group peptidase (beta-lactamase class C family)
LSSQATKSIRNLERLEGLLAPVLRTARIPGAAVAVVADGRTVYARGFGYRDLTRRTPVMPATLYPIASTTKAINATLLGMLVEEGRLEWDACVQRYLPGFRLSDTAISPRVTLRDLVTMQTGLPRHDWLWIGNPMSRGELVARVPHLPMSCDFRRRFQYSNLSTTLSGHVAEIVTGRTWERLVAEKIFRPLGMRRTRVSRPSHDDNVTLSYHETGHRRIRLSARLAGEMTAPSGGAVHSTVADMTRWLAFNLSGGRVRDRRLIRAETLAYLQTPQVLIGDKPLAGLPRRAAYGMGWVIHPYNGHHRIWHGGYHHDVNSSVMLFPDAGIGIVSFINFGGPMLADLINQYVFDVMMALKPEQTFEDKLADYEQLVQDSRKRYARVPRVSGTRPSQSLDAYAGPYRHAAYGDVTINRRGGKLVFRRNALILPLKHWHYDIWMFAPHDRWGIHLPHAFDPTNPLQFHVDPAGTITALSIRLDPSTAPIRFERHPGKPV